MKILFYVVSVLMSAGIVCASCQRSYIDDPDDRETSTIDFRGLTASCDSACMYDTIVITADAAGENLKYEWQHAKGSLVPIKDEPDKVYFWGCNTCIGRITVSCRVSNGYGAYTKTVDVFVWPWTKDRGRFPGWEKFVDALGQW